MRIGGERLVLHPRLEALLWLKGWAATAICTAIVWQFVATGTLQAIAAPKHTASLSLWCFLAILAVFPLVLLLEIWWSSRCHVRANYDRAFARKLNLGFGFLGAILAIGYLCLAIWLLGLVWRWLGLAAPAPVPGKIYLVPALPITIALYLVTALVALAFLRILRMAMARTASVVSILGPRGILRGVSAMLLIRLRHPRRDFFLQAPVIGAARVMPFAIAAYWFIPYAPFDSAAGFVIAGFLILNNLDYLAPPAWLFLGNSKFESFEAFQVLRRAWGYKHPGVTLLNREAEQAIEHYWADRERMIAAGHSAYKFFNRPTIPRVWSLRTRTDMWVPTVKQLLDRVAVIVVDARQPSEMVRYELEWVSEPERAERCWFISDDDGTAHLLDGRPHPPGRVASLAAFVEAEWSGNMLRLDSADAKSSSSIR